MWVYWLIGVVLLLVALYPLQGWITYVVHQRQRERRYILTAAPAHRPRLQDWRADQVTICWLGHATVLINFYGRWILTDPVFGRSVGIHLPGGISFGPRRLIDCPLRPAELPPLDLVVQSHAHMDHLDTQSWRQLPRSVPVVMATNNGQYLRRRGLRAVTELRWGESTEVAGVRVTAVAVRHWGARFPWSRDDGYNAYLLERNGRTILFGGDTAFTDLLTQATAGKVVDVAILPIGGYQPYLHAHASPEQAWAMSQAMGARFLSPIHHQTFILSYEPPTEPLERLVVAAGPAASQIVLREIGETFILPEL